MRKLALSLAGCAIFSSVFAQTDTTFSVADTSFNSLPNKSKVYPLLYRSQTDTKLVSSIGYLKGAYLESTPTNSPIAGITGRMAGLYISQFSGEPGADIPFMSLRGRAPMIFIDGVPRDATAFNPEQIESVVVLKDALSTAMLGMRGMNGAILINTRKGRAAKDMFNLNFKVQTGVQSPTQMRKYLSAFDYANLYNEALANDGKAPIYSQADLDAYQNGTDPFGHPNVDWTKTILKDNAAFNRYSINAEGSSKAVNYFVSLDYLNQGGLLKESGINSYSTNSTFKRYVFRSNLEMRIDNRLNVFLNLFGRIREGNEPGVGSENILPDFNTTPNNAYPVFNPDGSLGGNINYQGNIYGKSIYSGYYNTFNRDGFVDAGFTRKMDDLLKGWWVKGFVSFNTGMIQEINRSKQFQVFKMGIDNVGDTTYQQYGPASLPQQANSSFVTSRTQQFYTEISTGISRSIGNNDIEAMLLASTDNSSNNFELTEKYKRLAAQVQYSWSKKYILQAAAAYNGNNRFIGGSQAGFFPSAGLAWNLHEEKFLAGSKLINTLKLRASYGLVGNASPGYYDFIKEYGGATGYVFGTGAGAVGGISEATLPYNRTWEKSNKLNLGLDLEFSQKRGWFSFDYFKNKFSDLLQIRGNNTTILGVGYPLENLGKNDYSGIEMNLGWADQVGKLQYNLSANISTLKTKVIYNDEPGYPYSWMLRTGHAVGQFYGYQSDGFVTTAGEGPVMQGYQSVPGDIKYVDLNNDGVINLYDQTSIGHEKPLLFYGFNANLHYKRFYFSLLVQGVANRQIMLTGNSEWEFQSNGKGQAYPHHLNRWTPATAASATYPRLTVGNNINNNVASDFWIQKGDYLRLKNIEIGYDFSGGVLRKASLEKVRVFVNGLNLITISSFDQTDPETPFANYPVQRVINAGISITL